MMRVFTVVDLKTIAAALDKSYYENQRIPEAQTALALLVTVLEKIAALPEFRDPSRYVLECFFCDYTGKHAEDCLREYALNAIKRPDESR